MNNFFDLTYDIYEGMTTFGAPWHPFVSIKQIGRHGFEGRETREITFGTHTGTQIDAPLHFISSGPSVEKIPLKKLIGPVTIVDLSSMKNNEEVTPESFKGIHLQKKVLCKFGWGKYWDSKAFYEGYPFFSPEAALYLITHGVELVGFDTPSPDDSRIKLSGNILGTEIDSPIHKIFLQKEIILLEYIANLENLHDYDNWTLVALPLRIRGADGSPARACLLK